MVADLASTFAFTREHNLPLHPILPPFSVDLLNALKFSRESSAPEIRISASEQDGRVVVSVENNGIGIESQYREQIFGLFNRLNQSYEGTGIGLALVKHIVEVHGGSVWVESEGKGRDACLRFSLPAMPRAA